MKSFHTVCTEYAQRRKAPWHMVKVQFSTPKSAKAATGHNGDYATSLARRRAAIAKSLARIALAIFTPQLTCRDNNAIGIAHPCIPVLQGKPDDKIQMVHAPHGFEKVLRFPIKIGWADYHLRVRAIAELLPECGDLKNGCIPR
jgi:hypothetical protein